MRASIKKFEPMYTPNFDGGDNYSGLLMTSFTVLLYAIASVTLNQVAAICTIIAALTTAALNIRKFLKK